MAQEFLLNRETGWLSDLVKFSDGRPQVDRRFAGERLDGEELHRLRFEHCAIANVSFLESTLVNCEFENCVFVSCYFRKTTLESSTFTGCRFINCDFPVAGLDIRQCDFRHATFRGCYLPYVPGKHNLPTEQNLRSELAGRFALEAEQAGNHRDARSYRRTARMAHERNLWKIAWADGPHYQRHNTARRRVRAGYDFAVSRFNRFLWGYGEQAWRPAVIYSVLALGLFPLVYMLFRSGFAEPPATVDWLDATFTSLGMMLSNSALSPLHFDSQALRLVAAVESVVGLVFIGLLVTLLFRWITRR